MRRTGQTHFGEIVIDGRSSSTFTDSDFDSYRNTYIGFIFQEYNILNEFTVEENVGIALELQGKSHDEETIRKTLRDVEIEDLAKRKPNTLSGGQKQRDCYCPRFGQNPKIIMENAIRDNYILSDDDSYYYIDNSFNHYLARYLSYIEITTTVFFIVGLGMAFFAVLLFNMIFTSVSSKKQEIGILRAVGARSKDIFNIFMAETFTIMAKCIVLSVILTATVCTAFNTIVSSQLVIRLALFIYTPLSALITIAIAIVTALVPTTLPVYKIAKKCPAGSICTL